MYHSNCGPLYLLQSREWKVYDWLYPALHMLSYKKYDLSQLSSDHTWLRLRLWTDFADIGVKKSTRTNYQRIFQNLSSTCHKRSGLSFPTPKSFISLFKTWLMGIRGLKMAKTRFYEVKKSSPMFNNHYTESKCLKGIALHPISYPPNLLSKTP